MNIHKRILKDKRPEIIKKYFEGMTGFSDDSKSVSEIAAEYSVSPSAIYADMKSYSATWNLRLDKLELVYIFKDIKSFTYCFDRFREQHLKDDIDDGIRLLERMARVGRFRKRRQNGETPIPQ